MKMQEEYGTDDIKFIGTKIHRPLQLIRHAHSVIIAGSHSNVMSFIRMQLHMI